METQEDTKTCPFCAEQIRGAAVICRFCNADLVAGARPAPKVEARDASCERCNVRLIVRTRPASVSVGGVLGIFICLAGIPLLVVGLVPGLLAFGLGIIVSVLGRQQVAEMVCPQCRRTYGRV
ncbi:MAG: hypothetical protein R3F39_14185 [Myxococcota bacterium]